jgi:hypothetical protein
MDRFDEHTGTDIVKDGCVYSLEVKCPDSREGREKAVKTVGDRGGYFYFLISRLCEINTATIHRI